MNAMATVSARSGRPGSGSTGPLKGPARDAWAALFVAQRLVIRETERRLAEAGLPPLAWYDVLYNLYVSAEEAPRQCNLAERIQLSPSGLSRLLDRMVERGVVERHEASGDRRAAELRVTEAGVELMREMWERYGRVIEEHFAPAAAGHEEELSEVLWATARSFGASWLAPGAGDGD